MALGKRKRDDDMSFVVGTKRQRISIEYPQQQERFSFTFNMFSNMYVRAPTHETSSPLIDIDSIPRHIPAPKPKPPSLLLLPAELRAKIWEYAYGNLQIEVSFRSPHNRAETSHKNLAFTVHKDYTKPHPSTRPWPQPPQRVCKQFYSEVTTAIYLSSTFHFTSPNTFRAFALSAHPSVPKLRRFCIPALEPRWATVLTSSILGKLQSLSGVHMTHTYWRWGALPWESRREIPDAAHPHWKWLWRIVRAVRQHKLKPHMTRFELVYMIPIRGIWPRAAVLRRGDPGSEDVVRVQGEFEEALLAYTPRRLSMRCSARSN